MNVLDNIPYNDDRMGKRTVVEGKQLLLMQIALRSGQSVPRHNANSNVHLLIVRGVITVNLDGVERHAHEGDLVPVKFGTPMVINNGGADNATFLVLKTPHPLEMKTGA